MTHETPDLLAQAEYAYTCGDYGTAQSLCKLMLTRRPTDLAATVLLGLTFGRTGQSPVGIVYLKNAVKWDPLCFEAHIGLCTLLCKTGKIVEGLEHGRHAIESAPEDPDGHIHLGLTLVDLKRFPEAVEAFAEAVRLAPDNLAARQNLATSHHDSGRDVDAKVQWEELVKIAPDVANNWFSLGQLCLQLGELDEAVRCAQRAVTLGNSDGKTSLLLALALSESGESSEAETHLRRAIELDPSNGIALAALGFWQQEQGDFEGSRESLERAIELAPTHGFAYYNLYRCKKATADDQEQIDAMKAQLASQKLHGRDFSYLSYALGKAHEDLGKFAEAMQFYDAANSAAFSVWLAHKPWDAQAYAKKTDDIIRVFSKERLEAVSPNESACPILIIGMMRSGTSLVEQILSAHSDVHGGGELSFWHEHETLGIDLDSDTVDEDRLRMTGEKYVEQLRSLSTGARHVTDKLPHNYSQLGMIHKALPNAKFVHVRRNPVDNCLSIYTTAYQRPPVFGHDRENIAFAYREYQRFMTHWKSVLPHDAILEVDYEDLISDRERVTRQMLEFCGLEWQDGCLHHETNARTVRTPSLWQVRQPIYSSSVERWRRFEPWIAPFDTLATARGVRKTGTAE